MSSITALPDFVSSNPEFFDQPQTKKSGNRDRKKKRDEKNRRRNPLQLEAKTDKQADYLDALKYSNQVFGIGGAGTGKTYIPSRLSIQALQDKQVSKVIITRPTVTQTRHRMGFLPGNADEKMAPWLVPIISAMKEQVNPEFVTTALKNKSIEVVGFEHMRGRTFKDAYVILDEAQNCTLADLRLFLTRIGEDATVVITGDTDQVDIPDSGLQDVLRMVEIFGLSAEVIEFGPEDVVRSKVAREWVEAFARSKN